MKRQEALTIQFIMNNIMFWENKGDTYTSTPRNIGLMMRKRGFFPPSDTDIHTIINKMRDNESINIDFKRDAKFGTQLLMQRGARFDEFKKFMNENNGMRIK